MCVCEEASRYVCVCVCVCVTVQDGLSVAGVGGRVLRHSAGVLQVAQHDVAALLPGLRPLAGHAPSLHQAQQGHQEGHRPAGASQLR